MRKLINFIFFMTAILGTSACTAQDSFTTVGCDDFEKAISKVDSVQLLDVRTPDEYREGHLNNAILIDVKADSFLIKATEALPKNKEVAVYCRSGRRSAHAAELLSGAGYRVLNLDGGIMAWKAAGKKVVTTDSPVADSDGYIVYEGQPCPDFTVQLTDGRTLKMSQLRGKTVMLQFTASWCSVCRKEMPHIESDIWQRHKADSNFVLVGIDLDEPVDKVKKFTTQTGITYPLALDPGGKVFYKFAAPQSGVTRNVLVNAEGIIIYRTRLYREDVFAKLVKRIDDELAKH